VHLAACAECSAFLEVLALVDSAVAQLPLPQTESDDGFAARVRARIEAAGARAPQARGRRPSALRALPAWTWAAAAALLLAVVTPLTLRELRAPRERPALEAVAPPAASAPSPGVPVAAPAPSRVGPATVPAASREEAPEVLARLEEKPQNVPRAPKPAPESERLVGRERALGFLGDESLAPEAARGAAPTQSEQARDAATIRHDAVSAASDKPAPASPASVGLARDKGEAHQPAPAPPDALAEGVAGGTAGVEIALGAAAPQETIADREAPPNEGRTSGGGLRANEQQAHAKAPATAAPAPGGFAAKGAAAHETAAFGRLEAQRPQTAREWRQLREAWRALARAHPDGPRADEARVRAIEAATQAYRASAEEQDKRVLRRDIAEYLARKDAPEANRMRLLLRETER
jgi:hypothetical protein